MRIIGPDELVFGVDSLKDCRAFLGDYGLIERSIHDDGFRFEAQDGTALVVRPSGSDALPPPLPTATMLRETVWGCEDQETVDAIAAELGKDRNVDKRADGSILTRDDVGFAISFRVSTRRTLNLEGELINSPGASTGRRVNGIGADQDKQITPCTLSHVVYFSPDVARMESFYATRLGFVVTDRFNNVGPFMRPQANSDHHCLFMIQTPPQMQGLEHVAFHVQGPTDLMLAGSRLVAKGYQSFWGPGRHKFGSNWFWYFNSPLGAHVEYDADMDQHDAEWTPRVIDMGSEAAQMFLFENVAKWAPGGPPPKH